MIHGQCGQLNPNSPCMVDNSCSKKFLKQYCDEIVYVSDGGYPMYRRPNKGRLALVRQQEPFGGCFDMRYTTEVTRSYHGIPLHYIWDQPSRTWSPHRIQMAKKTYRSLEHYQI